MQPEMIQKIRSACPDLLEWDSLQVRTIKDPGAPLSVVSTLGVIHAGVEEGSAIYRLRADGKSFILKQHFDAEVFRREVANITFINRAGRFGPEIHYAGDETGLILMEDLGDESLAYVWKNRMMEQYVQWVYEAIELVVSVQGFYQSDRGLLRELYGGAVPERGLHLPLPDGLPEAVGGIMEVSRNRRLEAVERDLLRTAERDVKRDVQRFSEQHKDFILDITPWHVIRKDGRIRVIDLTAPPVGSVLFQFDDAIWHLPQRRDILRSYLEARDRFGLPHVDNEKFLRLKDRLTLLGNIDWIQRYCRDILAGEHWMTDMEGNPLSDYAESERGNLRGIRLALEPYDDFAPILELLDKYFSLPLAEG